MFFVLGPPFKSILSHLLKSISDVRYIYWWIYHESITDYNTINQVLIS